MWMRFTERARRVILLGQEEAGKMGSGHVGTEHLLLGLVAEDKGAGAEVLRKMGVSPEAVRALIKAEAAQGESQSPAEPKLTPKAKRVLELAADEARRMKHSYIGTEHLLLALLREKDGLAAKGLRSLGLSLEATRVQVLEYLGSSASDEQPGAARAVQSGGVVANTTNVFYFTAQAQLVLEVAQEEAAASKQFKLDTRHLLLALLSAPDCTDVLAELGLDIEAARRRVREKLQGEEPLQHTRRLQKELDVVSAAMEWAVEQDQYELAALLRDQRARLAAIQESWQGDEGVKEAPPAAMDETQTDEA